eukprot:NODE_442_length_8548_cov_0.231862.p3 type:complete len:294 gc:universal NODE_442_length_8548_cov_0.231862:7541-8422(+)
MVVHDSLFTSSNLLLPPVYNPKMLFPLIFALESNHSHVRPHALNFRNSTQKNQTVYFKNGTNSVTQKNQTHYFKNGTNSVTQKNQTVYFKNGTNSVTQKNQTHYFKNGTQETDLSHKNDLFEDKTKNNTAKIAQENGVNANGSNFGEAKQNVQVKSFFERHPYMVRITLALFQLVLEYYTFNDNTHQERYRTNFEHSRFNTNKNRHKHDGRNPDEGHSKERNSHGGHRSFRANPTNVDNINYAILGVPKGSGLGAIKSAYYKLARIHHPDKNGDAEKFKEISNAYQHFVDKLS